jgi:hypothetical protein
VPYCTRVLVRHPYDPSAATGAVVVEPLHSSRDIAATWPRIGRMLVREGWAWVGVTNQMEALAFTAANDPGRYADLDIPMPGLGFEIVAEIAGWLRSGSVASLPIDHLFMVGSGQTGGFVRTFLGEGFHRRTNRTDGAPSLDGYLIMASSGGRKDGGYPVLNNRDAPPGPDDPRRTIGQVGVPVIELLSEGEAETSRTSRRPDSDRAADPYRLYEVAGSCHASAGEAGTPAGLPETVEMPSDFPMYALAGGALMNLWRWVVDDEAPPRAERIEILASRRDGRCGEAPEALPAARDADGNALGGVRTPNVDVPAASYYPHSTVLDATVGLVTGDLLGSMQPFDTDVLRDLYGSSASYLAEYADAVDTMVNQRWILPTDGNRMNHTASRLQF